MSSNFKYTPDQLSTIFNTKKEKGPVKKPKIGATQTTASLSKGRAEKYLKFSEVFWKPKTIPDIPVPQFKPEDWDEAARLFIPDINEHWQWPKKETELLAVAMFCDDTTLIWGLMGTGKSELAAQWCAKLNIPLWRMNCNAETRETHFVGSPAFTYGDKGEQYIKQESTTLTNSLRFGGIFLEDEAFRHNSALVLQSLRERNSRKLILPDAPGLTIEERVMCAPKERWWYIMTDNTPGGGDETGLYEAVVQDASTLDRVSCAIEMPYLPATVEGKIVKSAHPKIDKDLIKQMVQFANSIRASFKSGDMLTTFSVRSLLTWCEKAELFNSTEDGLRVSWFNKLSSDDRIKAADAFHSIFAKRL